MSAPGSPPTRSSAAGLLLVFLAIGGSAIGVAIYQSSQGKEKLTDKSGFDLAEVERSQESAAASRPQARSGLGMITGAVPGMQTGERPAPPSNPLARATQSFTDLVRASEAKIQGLAESYSRRYPVVQQYGREWMKYPDLKKLNDDYMKNHDPVAFMKGTAASPNFGKMLRKYAGEKPIQDFVKESVKVTPPGALATSMEFLNNDKNLKGMVDNVAANLGIPPSVLSMASGGSKIDEKQVMQQILGGNPEMQRALANPEVQKTLSSQPGLPAPQQR